MFSIISTMFLGIGIGYGLRNWTILQKTEKTISLTIFLLLFILGVSIGSNSLIVNNLGKFGWQAIILAVSGVLLPDLYYNYFSRKEVNNERKSHRYCFFLCRLHHGSF